MRISFYNLTRTLLRNSSTLAHLVTFCKRRILAQLRLRWRIATLQLVGASVPASRRFTSPRLSITRTDRTITMSLRRSTRVSSKVIPNEVPNGKHDPSPASMAVKRGRKRKSTEEQVESAIQAIANTTKTAKDVKSMLPPPATPKSKRRKVAQDADVKPPPFTPTPSAIGLMTSNSTQGQNYSTGDIDDPAPPATRPIQKHHTNATLVTPGGTQLQPAYSNFEEASPSKPGPPNPTSKTLLDTACAHLIKIDSTLTKKLKPVIEQHHCHVFSPSGLAEKIDPFRSLSSGIMAQQVSGAAASSIKNKFIALFPPESCPNGFPPPALVAATDIATLRTAGLSQRKAEYIQGLAQKFDSGEITTQQLMTGSDEEVMKTLVAVRGLGAWSVEMFMCFGLKRLDVFSTGDLGVQRGMAAYIGKDVGKLKAKGGGKWKYMSEKDMLELAEHFRPYRSLFMWYMWRIENVSTAAIEDNAEE